MWTVSRLVSCDAAHTSWHQIDEPALSLDRTNYVQDVISSLAIAAFLGNLPPGSSRIPSAMLASAHRTTWADNGDNLSKSAAALDWPLQLC